MGRGWYRTGRVNHTVLQHARSEHQFSAVEQFCDVATKSLLDVVCEPLGGRETVVAQQRRRHVSPDVEGSLVGRYKQRSDVVRARLVRGCPASTSRASLEFVVQFRLW